MARPSLFRNPLIGIIECHSAKETFLKLLLFSLFAILSAALVQGTVFFGQTGALHDNPNTSVNLGGGPRLQ
jgi:hypothetical protein